MIRFLPLPRLRPATLGLLTLVATGACTKEPPGPVIGDSPQTSNSSINTDVKDLTAYDQLAWSDEFNDASLDLSKWNYEVKDVWYNNELEATTSSRDNVFVTGGNLNIVAKKQSYNGRDYTSGRITTKDKQSFVYGRYDVRAKLPKGKGVWPAIWMLGANDTQVGWPSCGEIDIMELRGSTPATNNTTLHFGTSTATHQYVTTTYTLPSSDFSTDFHVFSLVRGQNKMEFYVDGTKYKTWTTANATPYPFNNTFYGILNLAIGGDFDGNPDATTTFPQTMQVDYVRFYQYK